MITELPIKFSGQDFNQNNMIRLSEKYKISTL